MTTFIYVLTGDSGEVRYVGKTSRRPSLRLAYHVWEARRGARNHRCNWIRELLARGTKPSIVVVKSSDGNGCQDEIDLISFFSDNEASLTNCTSGGDGSPGCPLSEETRHKISAAGKGKKRSLETRQRMSLARIGKPCPESAKRKISEANRGRVATAEHRAKISASNMGRVFSPETKLKLRLARLGWVPSESTREKWRKARTGIPISASHREKISKSMKLRFSKTPYARSKIKNN